MFNLEVQFVNLFFPSCSADIGRCVLFNRYLTYVACHSPWERHTLGGDGENPQAGDLQYQGPPSSWAIEILENSLSSLFPTVSTKSVQAGVPIRPLSALKLSKYLWMALFSKEFPALV